MIKPLDEGFIEKMGSQGLMTCKPPLTPRFSDPGLGMEYMNGTEYHIMCSAVIGPGNGSVASFHWCENANLEELLVERATGVLFSERVENTF